MSDDIAALSGNSYVVSLESQLMQSLGLDRFTTDVLLAVAILIAAFILAKCLNLLLTYAAPRLVAATETTLDDEIVKAIKGPLELFVVVIGAYLAIGMISAMPLSFIGWLDQLLLVAVIFNAAYLMGNLVNGLLRWYKNDVAPRTKTDLDDMLVPFLEKIAGATIAVIAILVALEQLHIIEITPLITGLGIIGIAVALAAQEVLSSFFGSVAILVDRPYKVGDRVQIGDIEVGDVVEIGLRSTRIRTTDYRIIVVPNALVSRSRVINYAMPDPRVVFNINVGIAYDADVDKAARIMKEIALVTEGVLNDPAPKAFVNELGAFSVNLVMFVHVHEYSTVWTVPDKIYRQILKRFDEEGIEIPYPTTSVYVKPEHSARAPPAQGFTQIKDGLPLLRQPASDPNQK